MYEAVSDGVRGMSSRPVSYGQAQDTLAGAVCLLHEQGGLQYAVYGLTCVRTYLTGL